VIPHPDTYVPRRTRIVERKGELLAVFRGKSGRYETANRAELMDRMKDAFNHDQISDIEAHALFALDQAEKGREKVLHIH